ncbi:MAG: class I SAM-dependent methyltransferase [Verrucomicrobiales bacterium]|jgi:2-polyprenyl-3-methyl-5-hydroxy-6-metoxy-1,4-benzoquinol methylase|nr:class I SAM-dependent methyltransferase [Verrucomicrobiales bacterium]HQW28155.1 class I SAM-dependent methyltransferase [Verrucomicrobiales bacterium]
MSEEISTDYTYSTAEANHTNAYLWAPVVRELSDIVPTDASGRRRVFDLGCGNGALARHIRDLGFDVTGVDPSETGIEIARRENPAIQLEVGSAYEDLATRFGQFPAVVSLEVVEHVYFPRKYARCVHDLLEPGGTLIISTPYHSYLKNLALALSGKFDAHFTALWDNGHIKFWSVKTLSSLFAEQGLTVERVIRAGRIPILAKSMILLVRKG